MSKCSFLITNPHFEKGRQVNNVAAFVANQQIFGIPVLKIKLISIDYLFDFFNIDLFQVNHRL
jgi:hypothetical protein